MSAKNNKSTPKKPDEQKCSGNEWNERKQNLEHRIKALKKIIEQLNEKGKDKKQ
ncbi:MAG: hypothetical protein IH597_04845 [Bacteroidales bacterium]|nr:hypothetical protein [Bacteroidales bacterium]